ncbi:MAG: 2,4-dihydroxyhept-2-ene-1,7-dioic acid aldolase [Nitrososphaerales archaeon]
MELEKLKGSIVPLITPFTEKGEFDERTFRKLVDWQIKSGSHGISIEGTTGEPSALSLEERADIYTATVSQVKGRVPVVAGTGTNNLEETLFLTRKAEEAGVDASLVIVPYYNRPSQEGLVDYFTRVAKSTSLPIIIYNIPGRTATNMEPSTMKKLRTNCKNIVGVKEANKDFDQVSKVLFEVGRDFLVYSGIETLCYPMLTLGGAGHVSATANLLPKQVADLYNLSVKGKWEEALDLHYKLLPINEALFWDTNPVPLKAALGMIGKINPKLRPPLVSLSKEKKAKLRKVMKLYGL